MSLRIAHRSIGPGFPPFIIAEMSGNHNQSLARALEIVREASVNGAHAIKLQTYTPDTMTLDIKGGNFDITDSQSLWHGSNLYDLYKTAYTPWEWHKEIFDYASSLGLICFSSPFDESAVDFLETLDVPAYKIASFENNHLPLISKVASTGKPIIISTGMATLAELELAVDTARSSGCKDLILLKCTSSYPADPSNSNISTIPHLQSLFSTHVGLSDHTFGIGTSIASIALGACVIEKHFTLSRKDGGVDSAFSIEPNELQSLVVESERAWLSLGQVQYGPTASEQNSLMFKRSIYISSDIEQGDIFTSENIRVVRPGDGLPPHMYSSLLGLTAKKSFKAGTPLTLNDLIS